MTEQQKTEFEETYDQLKLFVAKGKGPALALATVWHLDQVSVLKKQLENLREELIRK